MKEKIKQIRQELGLNQDQLAKELGITQAAVSAMEKAVYGVKIGNIIKIVNLYKKIKKQQLNLNWLILGTGDRLILDEKAEEEKLLKEFGEIHNYPSDELNKIKKRIEALENNQSFK